MSCQRFILSPPGRAQPIDAELIEHEAFKLEFDVVPRISKSHQDHTARSAMNTSPRSLRRPQACFCTERLAEALACPILNASRPNPPPDEAGVHCHAVRRV
jgi:hypothetical protein